MRALLFLVAAIIMGHKWYCDACGDPKPPPTTSTTTTTTTTSPTTTTPDINYCWSSYYKAIIFLVDGSTSMGNGTFIQSNGTPVDWSKNWTTYNKWQDIKPMIDSFRGVISNNFTVVMKQYSSPDYRNWCCPLCSPNMTRVLKSGIWTNATWDAASNDTYTQLQNCDTYTYSAVIETITVWDQKRKELNFTDDDKALIILITDGEPSKEDEKNSEEAIAKVRASAATLFLVYPTEPKNLTSTQQNERKDKMDILKKLVNDETDSMQFDFALGKVDSSLRDSIARKVCENVQQQNG